MWPSWINLQPALVHLLLGRSPCSFGFLIFVATAKKNEIYEIMEGGSRHVDNEYDKSGLGKTTGPQSGTDGRQTKSKFMTTMVG